jgi:hypothetical protein
LSNDFKSISPHHFYIIQNSFTYKYWSPFIYVRVCFHCVCFSIVHQFLELVNNNKKKLSPTLSRPNFVLTLPVRNFSNQSNPKKKNDKCLKNNLIYSVYIYITIIWNLKQFSSAVLCVCVCVVSGYWFRLLFVCFFPNELQRSEG